MSASPWLRDAEPDYMQFGVACMVALIGVANGIFALFFWDQYQPEHRIVALITGIVHVVMTLSTILLDYRTGCAPRAQKAWTIGTFFTATWTVGPLTDGNMYANPACFALTLLYWVPLVLMLCPLLGTLFVVLFESIGEYVAQCLE